MTDELITIEPARVDHPEGEMLVSALAEDVRVRYGDDDGGEPEVGAFELSRPAGGTFLLARIEGRPVGCIGLRRFEDDVAEIRRMYVVPEARRRGVARALLGALEAQARRLGYRAIVLETGLRQPEAVALYESHGYTRIPNYGRWADSPLCVCLEKRLDDQLGSNSTGSEFGPRNA
ncbi:MAG: GNAT family N-acetyltransferase [Acidimicrobiia bacterium]